MELMNTILFLAIYPGNAPNFEINLGYGSGKLTREFYGYQTSSIVTSNISNQEGTPESTTSGSNLMFQILYRLLGHKFGFDAGARYSLSKHKIPQVDVRPGYDSQGIPTSTNFDLGGFGLIGTFTIIF